MIGTKFKYMGTDFTISYVRTHIQESIKGDYTLHSEIKSVVADYFKKDGELCEAEFTKEFIDFILNENNSLPN